MVVCKLCRQDVTDLHPIPPAILSREVIGLIDDDTRPVSDLELCADCINELIDGASPDSLSTTRHPQ